MAYFLLILACDHLPFRLVLFPDVLDAIMRILVFT